MATRTDRERATKQNERHQAILAEMLNEDANRYCADCRSKGPRWASWNIGVFVCIRCAGIHRNLGVHISKMKSVNLDTWAAEQIESIRHKGNGPINAMYEYSLPDNFRRPTDDSGVEAFIRSKYERKQYYKKTDKAEAKPSASSSTKSDKPKSAAKKKSGTSGTTTAKVSKTTVSALPRPSPGASRASSATPTTSATKTASPAADLLGGFEAAPAPSQPTSSSQSTSSDGMGAFMGAASGAPANPDLFASAPAPAAAPQQAAPAHQTDLFAGAPAMTAAAPQANKDSILSLYGSGQQPQMAGGAGFGGMPAGVNNGMSAGQMAYQQQVMMQQQMQQQMYMQQQLAMQQQQLQMQHQAMQVNQVQEQMSRLRMGGGAPNGQMAAGGWPQQQAQQPGQTMNNSLWN